MRNRLISPWSVAAALGAVLFSGACCPPGTGPETVTETVTSASLDEEGNVVIKVEIKTKTICVPDKQTTVQPGGQTTLSRDTATEAGNGLATGAIDPKGSDFKARLITARNVGPIGPVVLRARAYTQNEAGLPERKLVYEGLGAVVSRTDNTVDIEAVDGAEFDRFVRGAAQLFLTAAGPAGIDYDIEMIADCPPPNLTGADVTNVTVTAMGFVIAW